VIISIYGKKLMLMTGSDQGRSVFINVNSTMKLIESWRNVFLPEEYRAVSQAQAANIFLESEMKNMPGDD
jgi:fructose-1,6-bisphosphatase